MARLAALSPSPAVNESQQTTPSQTSDKENRGHSSRSVSAGEKRKSDVSINGSTTSETPAATSSAAKRRRVGLQSQAIFQREVEARKDKDFYDPDQDPEERRAVRKGMRDLAKELNDSRAEYMQATSNGLYDTVASADRYFKNVKQTADATIDSRLLVATGDLSYKKATQLALGDASTGVDIDDFVSRCIAYMRRGPLDQGGAHGSPITGTHRGRRTQTQRAADSDISEEEADEDQAFNWAHLGATACFQYNSRPCLTGFLLGPLSLQKRVRVQSQRRARQPRANLADAVRPAELTKEDLDSTDETANLTKICDGIAKLLIKVQYEGQVKVEAEVEDEEASDANVQRIMHKHGIADDGGVPLMRFCVNPKSFGQTVENLFYVSFLIKEGAAGLNFDSRGLPTLHPHQPTAPQEAQERGLTKNQAVFAIDYETWDDIITSFDVEDSLIPHRQEEEYDDGVLQPGYVNEDEPEDGI